MFRIGIIGGGQLGRMLCMEAQKLGFYVTILDPNPKSPACQISNSVIISQYNDQEAMDELFEFNDFVTFELESLDVDILKNSSSKFPGRISPMPETLRIIQDKLLQKNFLRELNLPISNYYKVDSIEDAKNIPFGLPFVLKTRRGGFDGRGNYVVNSSEELETGFAKLGSKNLYAEEFVDFGMEIAVLLAKDKNANILAYPVTETIQKNNICYLTITPARISEQLSQEAIRIATKAIESFEGAGVFAVELFVTSDNKVIINEISPRVHNSGHWTMEGSITSQFLQHIRAICGLPLGSTDLTHKAIIMQNLLGKSQDQTYQDLTNFVPTLSSKGAFLHIYGKSEIKEARKMGHINYVGNSIEEIVSQNPIIELE